jgi:hypothetical protein
MFEYFAKTISWFDKGEVVWLYDDGLKFVLEHRDCFTWSSRTNSCSTCGWSRHRSTAWRSNS